MRKARKIGEDDIMPETTTDLNLVEIRFNSSLAVLDLIQPITTKVCEQMGLDEDTAYWVWLATQEALNNAVKHGNKMDTQKMVLFKIAVEDGSFKIVVQDEGEGFDQAMVPDPTNKENLLKTSGRGIFYMKSFMDSVEYTNTQNGTTVTMVKHIEKVDSQ